jgi:hypothetical protein
MPNNFLSKNHCTGLTGYQTAVNAIPLSLETFAGYPGVGESTALRVASRRAKFITLLSLAFL